MTEKHNCCGCGGCAQSCPVGCITMQPDQEGFCYPVVHEDVCIHCGLCAKVCPGLCRKEERKTAPKAYAAYALDSQVRMESSSGGIFTLLAEHVLEQGGVVFGAVMSEAYTVQHIRVADRETLSKLRGSKYVQSDIGDTYIQARNDLKKGVSVLFSGTPCQIEGLQAFLHEEYENLFCVDFICHGVPSPMVWHKYVDYRAVEKNEITNLQFRDKTYGWKKYALRIDYQKKEPYIRKHREDLFMKAFLNDVCLRPSCYQCGFKKMNRYSDITLADFWGIENVCPEMDDDRGTSLVLVHSKKGTEALGAVCVKICCKDVALDQAIADNPSMISSVKKPKNRDKFLRKIRTEAFDKTVLKYAVKYKTLRSEIKCVLIDLHLWTWVEKIKGKFTNEAQ